MADSKQNPIVFRALQLVNEQRTVYGLRYNDFNRYRKHCAARTHRLRSTLKLTHGKSRDFKKLPVVGSDDVKDKYLELLLLEAERAWAYSQELLSLSLYPTNKARANTLTHCATGRFRRSIKWSIQLLSCCQTLFASSQLSAGNLLESTIYVLILKGRFLRYRDSFEGALIQLCVAHHLLDGLAVNAPMSRDQALAIFFSDEIGPEIRYCAHELGLSKAYDICGIVEMVSSRHKLEIVEGFDALMQNFKTDAALANEVGYRRKLGSLMWEDQPAPVRNPEVVDVLLKVQEAEAGLTVSTSDMTPPNIRDQDKKLNRVGGRSSKKGVAAYDTILLALSDAEVLARKLAEAQQIRSSTVGTRDIHFLHAFIVYQLLARRIQRDLLLISTLLLSRDSAAVPPVVGAKKTSSVSKPKAEQVDGRLYPAVVKLLDTVLQSLHQMRSLSIVDECPDLASAVEVRLSFSKGQRCLYLAHCYTMAHKFAEASTLVQYAIIHLREASSVVSDCDYITSGSPAYYPLSGADVDQLELDLSALGLQCRKDWFAFNGGSTNLDKKSFLKPLFFDIALNYVQLDMNRLQERAGSKLAVTPQLQAKSVSGEIESQVERRQVDKAKVEEAMAETPEPRVSPRGGLGSLLGGWWGRS